MRHRHPALVLSFLLVAAGSVLGQETTGTIAGHLIDTQGLAVPGASVTVVGPQGTKSVVSDAEGRFTIPFLTPGKYDVRAELQGFKTVEHKGINVGLGQTVDLMFKLEIGGLTETVQVIGTPDVINTTTTTIGANITSELLQSVPVGRRVSDTLYLAPGVSSSGTAGSANPSIGGGSALDNQYVIDGVNVTNTGYGALGSYSIVFGSLGNATPFDFVQEVQVKTGGYEAEFGQSTGGVVNILTKSGSNDIRGSLYGYARPSDMEGAWTQYQTINGSVQTKATQLSDTGAAGGFPVLRNRLFFFGAIDPGWERRTMEAPDGFPLQSLGSVDRIRHTLTYSSKATWQISSSHRIDASFFGDPSTGDVGPQRTSALLVSDTSSFSSLEYGGHNQMVRYNGVMTSQWLLEGTYARALNRINELPSVNQWRITNQTVSPAVITGGIGFYEAGNRGINNQFSAKSTHMFAGHNIKYGFEYDDVNYSQINQRTGPTFVAPDGRTTATGAQITVLPDVNFGKIYRVTRANFNSGRTTLQKYTDFFVQDSWNVTDRLVINPGVRYEQEKLTGTIIDNFRLKDNWAPRIGATYDLMGDGKTKVFGNSSNTADVAARALDALVGRPMLITIFSDYV